MAEKSYPSSQMYKPSASDCFILAHARRDANPSVTQGAHLTSEIIPHKKQNYLCLQGVDTKKNYNSLYYSASSLRRIHHPLNMMVSETATRKSSNENNFDPSKGFESSDIRNSKFLQPLWKEKEVSRKQLQYASLHNKRKIEEIQSMKAKLKCPRYDPDELLQKKRYHQERSSKSHCSPVKRYSLCGSSLGWPQSESLMMKTEDSLQNDFLRDNQISRWSLNDSENSPISSPPNVRPTNGKFVWNPVILPVSHSFSSIEELLENHDKNDIKEWFDSPGRRTPSSVSSGLTVAEETVKLTYYTRSGRLPDEHNQRRRANQSFLYNPSEAFVEDWCPNNHLGTGNYFEE